MTRVGTGPIAAFVAAVLAAALLAACGGSSADSSSTTSAASESGASDTAGQSGSQRSPSEGSPAQSAGHSQDNSQDQGNARQGAGSSAKSAKEIATPLKVSGGGSTQFRTKGGDNSIQEFGAEGDESELQEAAEAVHGFYVSRAAEEWGKACSYLAKRNIEQLASQSPRFKNAGCAPILAAFTQPVSASVNREITTVDAGSLRHDGEQGFLIYYGAGHTAYAIPLANEDGTWKVAALSGSTVR